MIVEISRGNAGAPLHYNFPSWRGCSVGLFTLQDSLVTQRVLGVHKTRLVGDGFVHTPHFSPSGGVTASHAASFQTRQEHLATDKMPYIQSMPEVHSES